MYIPEQLLLKQNKTFVLTRYFPPVPMAIYYNFFYSISSFFGRTYTFEGLDFGLSSLLFYAFFLQVLIKANGQRSLLVIALKFTCLFLNGPFSTMFYVRQKCPLSKYHTFLSILLPMSIIRSFIQKSNLVFRNPE